MAKVCTEPGSGWEPSKKAFQPTKSSTSVMEARAPAFDGDAVWLAVGSTRRVSVCVCLCVCVCESVWVRMNNTESACTYMDK